jgi:hypothetical protein
MRKRTVILSAITVTIVAAVFAGAATAAGNGQGSQNSGNGNSNAASTQSGDAPGKSADAPGQIKKAEDAAQGGPESHSAAANAPGQNKSSSGGVKPSNSTEHNTSAAAGSTSTKLYGNGQNAGAIAMQNGASADTKLYGPGNSQPHKVQPCGHPGKGNGGGFDVHALKSHRNSANCVTESPPSKVTGDPSTAQPVTAQPTPAGGVAGGYKGGEAAEKGTSTSGVLGAVENVGTGTLPFTGFPVWILALVALGLTILGAGLRRQTRAAAATH